MSDNNDNLSIPVGPGFRAFALGVNAGTKAAEKIGEIAPDNIRERAAFYWLSCGVALAAELPEADEDVQMQFIAGAATRQPPSAPVSIALTSLANAAFEGDDESSDDYQARVEVARIVREAAQKIEDGEDDGPLRDLNGNRVGTFAFDRWSS